MYIGDIFHIHVHVSSIWVWKKSYLWGSSGESVLEQYTINKLRSEEAYEKRKLF
jgi:hypothetical protein